MATASAFIDIPASAEQVWQLIGGFNSLPDWLPFIPRSELSEGGRVRSLQTADGGVVIERLQAFDDAAKTYSYSILQAPFPATDYLSTLKVEALGQGARVTWSGRFNAKGVSDEEVVALFSGIYQGGLEALRANYPA
ncbi:SRPBCC family protein [Pseudomonas sp. B2M1-30]|uniref:SRPBCC family protein n=1 Tax=Pseudomonas koreensis TaxID=198620 RepID=A0A9X2XGQ7_9PSED|nr:MULTISPECIES: SRPBCC family protein [Pseudomonas]MBV4477471.1 SRPBCC family protein [Pseudomonas botevensis]MCU0121002.1 SRPBCC family protein [Pseudomonas sp. B2M1-30]MCU7248258.1 SRPBCC family protein [Pseudomonas koreensis]MCU7259809.1 SRPBCC family protein [Pseudomonas koreensis]